MGSQGISLERLAGYYDRLTFNEKSGFRRRQIGVASIRKGERILDVGCGTGPLSLLASIGTGSSGQVYGVDIAPAMIGKARMKTERMNLSVRYAVASISALPYPDGFFDLVISSLMFHHLPVRIKRAGLAEVYRVLQSGGRFFLCDFGKPRLMSAPLLYPMMIWLSSTRFQLIGSLTNLLRDSRFSRVEMKKRGMFLEYYILTK